MMLTKLKLKTAFIYLVYLSDVIAGFVWNEVDLHCVFNVVQSFFKVGTWTHWKRVQFIWATLVINVIKFK